MSLCTLLQSQEKAEENAESPQTTRSTKLSYAPSAKRGLHTWQGGTTKMRKPRDCSCESPSRGLAPRVSSLRTVRAFRRHIGRR
jgi:hypothetical protein